MLWATRQCARQRREKYEQRITNSYRGDECYAPPGKETGGGHGETNNTTIRRLVSTACLPCRKDPGPDIFDWAKAVAGRQAVRRRPGEQEQATNTCLWRIVEFFAPW